MDVPGNPGTSGFSFIPDTQGSVSPQFQKRAHRHRQLNDEERQKLSSDTTLVSEFRQCKLEKDAGRNWDVFYKRNSTKFFKDRHWTSREFEELAQSAQKDCTSSSGNRTLLEVGCGVGNAIFPLLEENPQLFVYACDFSPRAVQFVKWWAWYAHGGITSMVRHDGVKWITDNTAYDPDRVCAFQCDVTSEPLTKNIPHRNVDIVTMLFVLSAIHPDKMTAVLSNVYEVLRPGGCVLFRDYGIYDHAMLRFKKGHKLSEHFYVRQDGTRAYYFTEEILDKLFREAGFVAVNNEYVLRETVNKKEGLCVQRVFVQGKFTKPGK